MAWVDEALSSSFLISPCPLVDDVNVYLLVYRYKYYLNTNTIVIYKYIISLLMILSSK